MSSSMLTYDEELNEHALMRSMSFISFNYSNHYSITKNY